MAYTEHILYMLGKHADYESEELLFTEEDLQLTMDTMFELQSMTSEIDADYSEALLDWDLFWELYRSEENENNSSKKFIPIYSDDGGVTASVLAFAAINRNTRFPEELFAVIDVLMREKTQQSSDFFSSLIIPWCGLPMQEDLFQEAKPLSIGASQPWHIKDTYFKELCELREQITAVNFRSKIDLNLEDLVLNCTLERMSSDTYDKESVSEAYDKIKRMIGE